MAFTLSLLRHRLLASSAAALAIGLPAAASAQTASQQSKATVCPDGSTPTGDQPCPSTAAVDTPAPAADPVPQAGAPAEQEIVVTGSRIQRKSNDVINPVQVLDSQAIEARGFSTLGEALNELPSFGVPASSPIGDAQSSFGAGQSFVDFLGLGSQRTLVLVNGRRFVSSNNSSIFGPTGTGGDQVDLNIIPTKLIDRVETVAAIGAPIYGSDAIAGTVNIILKKDYEGIDVDGQYGLSWRKDAPDYRFRFLAGKNFADGRGNITIAGEYNKATGLRYSDRGLTSTDDRFEPPNGTSPFLNVLTPNVRIPSISTTGIPLVGGAAYGLDLPLSPQQANLFLGDPTANFGVNVPGTGQTQLKFDTAGNLVPIDFGKTIGKDSAFNVFTQGGNGFSLSDVENLLTTSKRYSANALVSFEVNDDWRLFGEGWYSTSEGKNLTDQPAYNSGLFSGAGLRDGDIKLSVNNPFLSSDARALIMESIQSNQFSDLNQQLTNNQDYFYLGRANYDLQNGVSTAKVQILRGVGGIDGTLHVLPGRDWKFEATANVGRSLTTGSVPSLNEQNFLNAVNPVLDGSGNIVCPSGITNSPAATVSETCAPLDLFGNQISQAAKDYITSIAKPRSVNKEYDYVASLAGPLFHLTGGDISFALGYEHRVESQAFNPGTFFLGATTDQYPGVDFDGDGDPNDLFYGRSVPINKVYGKYHTNEIFGEFNGDLISATNHIPFIYQLSYQSAARYVWNSQAGGDLTWTAGAHYAPIRDIAFRGAYTRAIRAPSITEAFNPNSSSYVFADDPCDSINLTSGPDPSTRQKNCAATGLPADFSALSNQRSFPGYVFGNSALKNEVSDSFTAGGVFTPRFLRNFQLSADYVDIKLKNAISEFSQDQVLNACYDSTSFPTNTFCSLVSRDFSGTAATNANYGQLNSVGTSFFNSAVLRYKGVLADLDYRTDADFLGQGTRLGFAVSYQRLLKLTTQASAGDAATHTDGSIGYAHNKGIATLTYNRYGFTAEVQASYIGKSKIDPDAADNYYEYPTVGAITYINMNASYDLNDRMTLRVDVDNVFDKNAPFPVPAGGGTVTYFRSVLGRYIRVGAAVHF